MNQAIKEYWLSLEPRERMVLTWGAIIVSFILLYALLWQPLQKALGFMEVSVRDLRSNHVWMEQRLEDIQKSGAKSSQKALRGADQSLLAVVEKTANQSKVRGAIQQMVPNQETGDVRVVLEGVDFNQWVRWIDDLYKNYGVDVTQINAEKDDEKPNLAEIRMTFFRQ